MTSREAKLKDLFPKLCKDCKHRRIYYRYDNTIPIYRCGVSVPLQSSMVTGEDTTNYRYCEDERSFVGKCRPGGIYWEKREQSGIRRFTTDIIAAIGWVALFCYWLW